MMTATQEPPTQQMPAPAPQVPAGAVAQGQSPSPELTFDQLLQQHVARAIQPVLADFQQQMAAAPASLTGTAQGVGEGTQQVLGAQQQGGQPAQPATSGGPADQRVENEGQRGPQHELPGPLRPAVDLVEHQGTQWLQSLLVAALTALLTESTRAAVQQGAEQGLHTLLGKAFEALPDGASSQEMKARTERTLQTILREALDAVFAEALRTTVQQQGEQAIQQSFQGNTEAAVRSAQATLKAMVDALATVLRRQRQRVLRLLLAVALLALEGSLESSLALSDERH